MKKILVAVVVVILLLAGWYFWKNKSEVNIPNSNNSLPTSCVDQDEGTPVITSLSIYSGSVGQKIEVNGCNFSGFEGDKNVWIENEQGVKGLLRGETNSTSKKIIVTLTSPLCTKDTSYSGLPCDSELKLVSGKYKIFVNPWGKESNKVDFTVNAEMMMVKVYFAPKGSEQLQCNDVVAVERIVPKTEKVATVALEELLKGLTAEENKSYTSVIPTGSKLNSLTIVNGEVRADFNAVTEYGGGSCSMSVRTEQIRKTLLQFPTIKTVKLSVDGRTTDIFQP